MSMKARRQQGYLLIVAAVIIMIVASMAAAMLTLNAGSSGGGSAHVLATQALYVAESGLEYEQRLLAQNVAWYRTATDPFDMTTAAAGAGTYTVLANVPATEVRTRLTVGGMTLTVFGGGAANRWPASGTLLIDDLAGNGEFVTYSSTNATSFTLSARDVAVGTVQGAVNPHARGEAVYPVATLSVALVANCATIPNPFNLSNNSKFLDYGTITVFHDNAGVIEDEQISYAGFTVAGGVRTLLGVQRCQNGTTAIAASVGDPVAPLVMNVGGNDFEALVSSIGSVGPARRSEYKVVQR